MDKADILIVGGGMAGLSAATTLCEESDLRVVLLEEAQIGSNQAIRAVFVEAIDDFGLRSSVVQEYRGFIWHSPLGALARFDYPKVALAGLDYRKACEVLYERAVRDGLVFVRAKAMNWSPEVPSAMKPLTIHLDTGESIQAEVLIDASGYAQWAANRLGVHTSPYYSLCYGELLTECSSEEPSYFRFLGPNRRYGNGGGWFYPTGADSVSMGYSIVVREKNPNLTNLVSGYTDAKQEFRPYSHWVRHGLRERIERGVVPVGRIGRFVSDRILIVGDAAGHANPWSVEGCRPCLINGRISARVVLDAFSRGDFGRSTLSSFERQWSKVNRERFWRTATLAELTWSRSDQEWDRFIATTQHLPPDQQLSWLRDHKASWFQQIYAVMGHARRQLVKWIRNRF